MTDSIRNRRQSLYFPADIYEEVRAEAKRLDRSTSWVVVIAWKLARERLKKIPSEQKDEFSSEVALSE